MHTAINWSHHHTELQEYGVNFIISFNIQYYICSWKEYMEETQFIPTSKRNVDNEGKDGGTNTHEDGTSQEWFVSCG